MTHDDAQVAGAERACGLDKFALAGGEDLAADQSRIAHPSTEGESEHQVEDPGTAERNESNRQQDSGEGQECIHHDDVEEAVDPPSVVAGD